MNNSPRPKSGWLGLPPTLLISLGLAIVGMVFSFNIYSSQSHNGVVTQCTSINIGAFLVIIACLVLVGVAMGQRRSAARAGAQIASPALYGGAIALVILLCVVHVFRGLGMIGGAC